ncbi:MAG TPA: glycosyltransferase family 9 protein [Candidatus Bathyarchaeia archaeon]|nr:glycosyltransferase family 9 protein [Candidatus Bathyarchaeia archaeon]
MTINLMRNIDSLAGRPICFMLSCYETLRGMGCRLMSFFRRQQVLPRPKKILFIKLSELGAIIVALPLLKSIREEYPEAELFFLTFEENRSVFEVLGGIIPEKNIFTISENSLGDFLKDTWRRIYQLRGERMDIIFDLEMFSRLSAILSYLSNAKKRIGFHRYSFEGLYRGNLFTHHVPYNPLNHTFKSYLSFMDGLHLEKKKRPALTMTITDDLAVLPAYEPSEKTKQVIAEKLRKFSLHENTRLILINPGGGLIPIREWPIENFLFLMKKLLNDSNNHLVIVGSKNTAAKQGLLSFVGNNERCLSLAGQTTLPELIALFNISNALITNDCGMAHLASLSTVKTFVMFGPESPAIFSPLGNNKKIIYAGLPCSPCLSALNHRKSVCKDNKCLQMISPEHVYAMICDSFKKTGGPGVY